jgi:hypothetical protein
MRVITKAKLCGDAQRLAGDQSTPLNIFFGWC